MKILGISCFYHDSAACLVSDGEIVAAAQEERFSRKKHDEAFPKQAIAYCLEAGGISMNEVDFVAFYDDNFLKFERLLETYLNYIPKGLGSFLFSMPVWLREKFWILPIIRQELDYRGRIVVVKHHLSHAASAFFPSPFKNAAFIVADGVGEWSTTSFGVGRNNHLKMKSTLNFPHSLGLLYSAFTYYTGFKVNSGEYKVMGLAPYGEPKYADLILEKIIDLCPDGSFKLDMKYFNYAAGLTMTSEKFHQLFGGPPREPESPLTQKEMDLAASLQKVTEEVMLRMAKYVKKETGDDYLCLAGGVALNCVANGRILKERIFKDLWIQPAAGDAGGALGAALFVWYQYLDNERTVEANRDSQKGSLLGPQFSCEKIREYLNANNIPYEEVKSEGALLEKVADFLSQEKVIGWFQGRMEFGPRALGNRSIIGDARSPKMQKTMNLKIKFRESFRPFAPSVLEEEVQNYFEIDRPSPYMLLTAYVKEEKWVKEEKKDRDLWGIDKLNLKRSVVPAITHVDYSARLQTVNQETNPRYWRLIKTFYQKTNCPVIINTSFNVRGEPIVATPEDAYRCFMRTGMDYLVLENFILDKSKQLVSQEGDDWKKIYELD